MVHRTNVLTVVASESYQDFVAGLQKDISESLSERPRIADAKYFCGKHLQTDSGGVEVTQDMAKGIEYYLIQEKYVDRNGHITEAYHEAIKNGDLVELPEDLKPYREQIFQLVDSVYRGAALPEIENDRAAKTNLLNDNFKKKEFQELWSRINRKAAYKVEFKTEELVIKCVAAIDQELKVTPLEYQVVAGELKEEAIFEEIRDGKGFRVGQTRREQSQRPIHTQVRYDLIGKISEAVQLTRKTVSHILANIQKTVFDQFAVNPEQFMTEASRLINEQKATLIIEHLAYNSLEETHDIDIFTEAQSNQNFRKAGDRLKHHIYDYAITDSEIERKFVNDLDASNEVIVYAKLPRGFFIPTPVGNYNPDWAIAFQEGCVKHVYFVAETKGSMSTMQLKKIEQLKIDCARRFFDDLNQQIAPRNVHYDVVDSYEKLMDLVGG